MTYSKDVYDLNREQLEATGAVAATPASKYGNVRSAAAGLTFQSGHEAAQVGKLILAEKHHAIFGLRLQVRFPLAKGVTYVADAVYSELRDGKLHPVVADAKGFRTRDYRIKARLFREKYGQEIEEL